MTTVADEIAKLKDLHDRGALSDEEFEREKDRLLRRGVNPARTVGDATYADILPRRKGLGIDILLYMLAAIAIPDALFQAKLISMAGFQVDQYGVLFPALISPLLEMQPAAVKSELGIVLISRAACILVIPILVGVLGSLLPRVLLPVNGFLTAAGYIAAVWFVPALVIIAVRGAGAIVVNDQEWIAIGLGIAAMGAIFAVLTILRLAASRG